MTERPLDKTQQDYVDHGGLVNLLQSIKHGLHDLTLTKTRDGKGGLTVSGLRRVQRITYEIVYDEDFIIRHEKSIHAIQFMRSKGMLISPNPKTSSPERIQGGNWEDAITSSDSIRRKFDEWRKYEHKGQRPAIQSAIRVFGECKTMEESVREMRNLAIKINRKTIEGLAAHGLELFAEASKKVDRDSNSGL